MDYFIFQQINPVKDFFAFLTSLDISIFNGVNNLAGKSAYLDSSGIFFAKYLGYVLVVLVFLFFWRKWKIVLQSFLAAAIASGTIELIRFLWDRPRPFIENSVNLLVQHSAVPSFPSGHAAFFFALSTVIFIYYKKVYPRPKFWWGAGTLFFIASFLISISRVFAGVHWPLDILAGALIGTFSGWLVMKLFKKS